MSAAAKKAEPPRARVGRGTRALSRALATALAMASVALAGAATAGSESSKSLPSTHFVFFNPASAALPPSDIFSGLAEYSSHLGDIGLVRLTPHYFKRARDLEQYLAKWHESGEMPWFGSMSIHYLLQRGFRWGYRPLTCALVDGATAYTNTLVVRRDSPFHSLEDVRNHRVALTGVGVDVLQMFNVLLFANRLDMRTYFSEVVETDSAVSTVMAVMYKQADVAIIIRSIFQRLLKHSPFVWRWVREIHDTPPLPYSGHVVWQGAPPELVERFRKNMVQDLGTTPAGRKVLDLFHLDGFVPCDWQVYDDVAAEQLRAAGVALPPAGEREHAIREALSVRPVLDSLPEVE
ncbi:MAG: PhnD/SsuA/transferrin family substrate-binding protein [Candidatus Schekmanbacteria bacterium]|nr:PhnD/SsuA/transferrin family substrate-binding protein [Candidatus Schekmanbacteria bacterium]